MESCWVRSLWGSLWILRCGMVIRPRSYQERALPTELCGPPALYSGGGRI